MYVSIDIETTGLNPGYDQVLEIGAVLDDGKTPVEDLPTFHAVIGHERIKGDPFALNMNARVIKMIAEHHELVVQPEDISLKFAEWLVQFGVDPRKITAAGKNFASFDKLFLERLFDEDVINFRHRCLDPGSMYYYFGEDEVPNTKECCARANVPYFDGHCALDDAFQVVRLIRASFI